MLKISTILIAVVLVSLSIYAQQKDSFFGWDLTYKSVLERNNVPQGEWIWKWVRRSESPAEKWISNWQGKRIVSSILVEFPAFHAAERTTMWFVRTSDEAYYWEVVEGRETEQNEESLKPQVFDAFFREVSSWQQLEPKPAKDIPKDVLPGYFGFLSFYDKDGSKQMLLTMEDFIICLDKSCMPGKLKSGRFMAALKPIISPEDPYTHKSEAEIARMTPAQRIDEEISEGDHSWDIKDNQQLLIRKYRRKDGLKGWSHLIELINGYNPKRPRVTGFYNAMMIADKIDGRDVRLRASSEGKSVIEAIERLSARRRADGKSDESIEMVLESANGVNEADRAIRDTLWVKYRIKMSDSELLEFSNYLVKNDPTYPSWSERKLIMDYSRKNEWGNPLQVFIMTKPTRYYQLHRAFKKQKRGH